MALSKGNEENKEDEFNEEEDSDDEVAEIDQNRAQYLKILGTFMKEQDYSNNMVMKGKIISLMQGLKYNKGIVITGPRCSAKTAFIKGLGYLLLNSDENIEMRISIMNPDIYSMDKLYGSADSGVMNPEISTNKDVKISSIASNVLSIALKGFGNLNKPERKYISNYFVDEEEVEEDTDEIERPVDVSSDDSRQEDVTVGPKLLKTLLFESSSINPLWSD
jgi:hypothetical protein